MRASVNLKNGNQNKIHKYKRRLHFVAAVLCYSQNKNPNPSPISEKFGFDWFGEAHEYIGEAQGETLMILAKTLNCTVEALLS